MAGSFDRRMSQLRASGDLVGSVVVDQVYAQYQHESLHLRHPRGGQAKYLEHPLHLNYSLYMEKVANTALEDRGTRGMVDAVEHLSDQVKAFAPVDLNNLRRSASPSVRSGWRTVYRRPAEQRRLTEEEIEASKVNSHWKGWQNV